MDIALARAFLGDRQRAEREGRRAAAMLPFSLDAVEGDAPAFELVEIYVLTENYAAAIEQLRHLLALPTTATVWRLRLEPILDPLRREAAFQELLTDPSKVFPGD